MASPPSSSAASATPLAAPQHSELQSQQPAPAVASFVAAHQPIRMESVAGPSAPPAPPRASKSAPTTGTTSASTSEDAQPSSKDNKQMQLQLCELQRKFDELEKSASTSSVEDALQKVMELAHTPSWNARPQLLNALRVLVDRATKIAHPKLNRFRAVLAQFETNDFGNDAGHLILLLLSNKEEEEIASKVSKFVQRSQKYTRFTPYRNRFRQDKNAQKLDEVKCFVCGVVGHIARNCKNKK
ncbi:uncharacterized protein [Ptychodera flava]|uniref:uncharacterized protein n=1 Tax=Ptychodera flava TaxID=63121 RepID=UPI00396A0601